ncbi:ccch zinc finger DNA-binding protein [Grosmannia clavigera kw1407]|uniref:Ccch zinc finger DNA-binding protein n=1 Tax=Grosmannia clavigera (strain kw1407 / UAMH 11150) TaxID=655863 RepID=F0XN63_GROCL|nr:ccch zinc finger DNA-binding protein [Grosmannia clavigera kw1407]EFX00775.1 ccch zinc finger DNA-binding protein [Grosmannia clavigera kw1407]
MVSDETYDICLPVLQDVTLEDEDKIDKLETLLKRETALQGQSLENAVLDAVWRYREGGGSATSPPPIRQTILRRPSPASWRGSATPLSGSPRLGVSPLAPPGYVPPAFNRTNKSAAPSPFSSPRPSPRLAFATPAIPHSPSLNAYEFASDNTPAAEIFGDSQQTDNVDWLVSDDNVSVTSSVGTSSGLNAAAPEFSLSSQQSDMTPYDMLRSILGPARTDDEIDAALSVHGYDLGATISAIMDSQEVSFTLTTTAAGGTANGSTSVASSLDESAGGVLIGKSMTPIPDIRPGTPADQKSGVLCKFFLSTGQCLRADCRFSHDLSNHICNRLNIDGRNTPPPQIGVQLHDYNAFPMLQPATPEQLPLFPASGNYPAVGLTPPPGFKLTPGGGEISRPRSRPGSRHQVHKESSNQAAPSIDDTDAFPSLGSASSKTAGKKHHGKRGGHGHHKENATGTFTPNSLADIVKMSPSPGPETVSPAASRQVSRKLGRNGSSANLRNGENSATAQAIPTPKHIPWLETGDKANKAYLKARQEAIKHGGLRNKFLQSAAQAWNRNDARAAKALSLRGQSENDLMRKAHREAARELYEERNKYSTANSEIYVDLHGLHAEEAVEYLERVLLDNGSEARPVYAITGTGHHSKNGKDKVGKAIRGFLNEWRYAYREFSVPSDRNNMGGILGIDARSWDKSQARAGAGSSSSNSSNNSNSNSNNNSNSSNGISNSNSDSNGSSKSGSGGGALLTPGRIPSSATSAASTERRGPTEKLDILAQGVEIGDGKVKLLVRDSSIKDAPKTPSGRGR